MKTAYVFLFLLATTALSQTAGSWISNTPFMASGTSEPQFRKHGTVDEPKRSCGIFKFVAIFHIQR